MSRQKYISASVEYQTCIDPCNLCILNKDYEFWSRVGVVTFSSEARVQFLDKECVCINCNYYYCYYLVPIQAKQRVCGMRQGINMQVALDRRI